LLQRGVARELAKGVPMSELPIKYMVRNMNPETKQAIQEAGSAGSLDWRYSESLIGFIVELLSLNESAP
jgi:hypothetical protein